MIFLRYATIFLTGKAGEKSDLAYQRFHSIRNDTVLENE